MSGWVRVGQGGGGCYAAFFILILFDVNQNGDYDFCVVLLMGQCSAKWSAHVCNQPPYLSLTHNQRSDLCTAKTVHACSERT